uniref:Uncharacterized protein n=1 Tax=Setaria digitata TaxID=48799 RepID=A0A915Q4A9_9BILA
MSQHRLSSSRRQSRDRDRERGNSGRDERSQRIRTLGNNDRRVISIVLLRVVPQLVKVVTDDS